MFLFLTRTLFSVVDVGVVVVRVVENKMDLFCCGGFSDDSYGRLSCGECPRS